MFLNSICQKLFSNWDSQDKNNLFKISCPTLDLKCTESVANTNSTLNKKVNLLSPPPIYSSPSSIPDCWMLESDKRILEKCCGVKRVLCELWVLMGRDSEYVCFINSPPVNNSPNGVYIMRKVSNTICLVRKLFLRNLYRQSPYFVLLPMSEIHILYKTCHSDYKPSNSKTYYKKFYSKILRRNSMKST